MPFPPLLYYIGSVVVSALVTYFFKDDIIIFFKGKRLAILGAKSVGKTTLFNFLTNGQMQEATGGVEKTKKNIFKLKELELILKQGKDITGSEDFVTHWQKIIKESDYMIYVVDGYKLSNNNKNYIDLVNKHLSLISKHQESAKDKSTVYVLFSFMDQVENYENDKEKINLDISNKIEDGLLKVYSFLIFGSLKDQLLKEETVYLLLQAISNNK